MSDDQFTKLFKYIEEFRTDVEGRFTEAKEDRADIRSAIAELGAQIRDYHHEMVAVSHQIDRLKEAILQIAEATGVKLTVEL